MDEGLPVAYQVLEDGVAVYASGGEAVGVVEHVVAAPSEDIFHGLVIRAEPGGHPDTGSRRFVAADQIASLHERGVDLRIDQTEARTLPEPHGGAPAWRDRDPGVKPSRWMHFVDLLTGAGPNRRNWTEED